MEFCACMPFTWFFVFFSKAVCLMLNIVLIRDFFNNFNIYLIDSNFIYGDLFKFLNLTVSITSLGFDIKFELQGAKILNKDK